MATLLTNTGSAKPSVQVVSVAYYIDLCSLVIVLCRIMMRRLNMLR